MSHSLRRLVNLRTALQKQAEAEMRRRKAEADTAHDALTAAETTIAEQTAGQTLAAGYLASCDAMRQIMRTTAAAAEARHEAEKAVVRERTKEKRQVEKLLERADAETAKELAKHEASELDLWQISKRGRR